MKNIIHKTSENENKTVITDTWAKGNYFQVDIPHFPSTNIGPHIHVGWPNGKIIQSRKPCFYITQTYLRNHVRTTSYPVSKISLLYPFVKLYYVGCTTDFKAQEVTIKRKGKIITQVSRDIINGLWKIQLTAQLRE